MDLWYLRFNKVQFGGGYKDLRFAGSFYGSAEGFSTVRFGAVEVRFYGEDL